MLSNIYLYFELQIDYIFLGRKRRVSTELKIIDKNLNIYHSFSVDVTPLVLVKMNPHSTHFRACGALMGRFFPFSCLLCPHYVRNLHILTSPLSNVRLQMGIRSLKSKMGTIVVAKISR